MREGRRVERREGKGKRGVRVGEGRGGRMGIEEEGRRMGEERKSKRKDGRMDERVEQE